MNDYELYHASTRKHKYIKKIGKRYFYTQQELNAYYQDTKQNDVIVKDDIVKDDIVKDVKTSPTYPKPKYAVMDGAYSTKSIANTEAKIAKYKKARSMAGASVEKAVRAASKTERAAQAHPVKSNALKKTLKKLKKQSSKGRKFLKELTAPPKISHKTVINSGGNVTVTYEEAKLK